jgi:hypothetical protein
MERVANAGAFSGTEKQWRLRVAVLAAPDYFQFQEFEDMKEPNKTTKRFPEVISRLRPTTGNYQLP